MIERGAILITSEKGALTKEPRPVLIVQNGIALARHSTITVCLISTALTGHGLYRIPMMPSSTNGLRAPSEVQIDRIFSMGREAFDEYAGLISMPDLERVEEALRRWLEL